MGAVKDVAAAQSDAELLLPGGRCVHLCAAIQSMNVLDTRYGKE